LGWTAAGSAPTYGLSDGPPETSAGPVVVRQRFARSGGPVQVLHRSFDCRHRAGGRGGSPGPGYGSWGFFVFGRRSLLFDIVYLREGMRGRRSWCCWLAITGPVVFRVSKALLVVWHVRCLERSGERRIGSLVEKRVIHDGIPDRRMLFSVPAFGLALGGAFEVNLRV
jgi:hypothetical protein